jgi:hypothetical protein
MKSRKKSNDMNLFRKMKERREEKRRLRELRKMAAAFATMDVMESKGLLTWDEASRRLLIDSRLALVMMRKAEQWQAFVRNLFLWTENREAWRRASEGLQRWELKAVRDYQTRHPEEQLTRDDIERIRVAARTTYPEEQQQTEMKAFEMVIVGMRAVEGSQGDRHLGQARQEPVPETADIERVVVAVGYYDPETEEMELARWEEVRSRLNAH